MFKRFLEHADICRQLSFVKPQPLLALNRLHASPSVYHIMGHCVVPCLPFLGTPVISAWVKGDVFVQGQLAWSHIEKAV
jgi:hypothetical protein